MTHLRRLLPAILLIPTAGLFVACGGLPTDRGSVADGQKIAEVSAEYEAKLVAARRLFAEDEKLIADQKDAVAAQTSVYRREEAQRKLKELEDNLEEDRKAIDRLVQEQEEEVYRLQAEAERQREAARAAQVQETSRQEEAEQKPFTPQQQFQPNPNPTREKTVHVNGYYRKNGTYVHPYNRRPPK
jgi:hypothetical protein